MKFKIPQYILLFVGIVFSQQISAQLTTSFITDIGQNNISEGLFISSAGLVKYKIQKTTIESACQFNILNNTNQIVPAFKGLVSHDFLIKKFPITVNAFFLFNNFSELLFEYNYGMLTHFKRNHFTYKLGTNFRTYAISKTAIETYQIHSDESFHENWNLMYAFVYSLNPKSDKYNLSLAISNFDYFIINQESNPMIYVNGVYNLNNQIQFLGEIWLKSSGAFNLSVNYFGFFVRTGILWKIDI